MSDQHLLDELTRLETYEHQCCDLIDLIEDGTQDLDLSADMETITLTALVILSDTIARKKQALHNLIEAKNNESMDRFRRRQIR